MKKFLTLLIACFLTFNLLSAQNLIRLKNGNVIKGEVIDTSPNGTVTIKSKDGNVATYSVSMIDKITKELKDADFTRDRGFHLTVEAETLNPWSVKFDKYYPKKDLATLGGNIVLGYKLNQHLILGVGYGANYMSDAKQMYDDRENGSLHHKAFIRGQYRLNDNKFSPTATIDFGFRNYKNLEDKTKLSYFVTPMLGISLRTTTNSYFEFKAGYSIGTKAKLFSNVDKLPSNSDQYKYNMSGVVFTIGWSRTFGLFSR